MRFIISSAPAPDKNLIGLAAIVKRWFAEKEGIASFKEGTLIEQTDKGYVVLLQGPGALDTEKSNFAAQER